MTYYETYENLPEEVRGAVIVIGNFDGVHLGHRALLERARSLAKKQGKKVGVLTFEPHPRELFRADEPFRRITPKDLKVELLHRYGADVVFSLPFDWNFASQPPQDFVQQILIDGLAASHIVIGYNFQFGQLRKGGIDTIRDAGLDVTVIKKVSGSKATGEISSSHIRKRLQDGQIEEARAILGWPWEIRGEIIYGDQRGRELGYPTANMGMGDAVHPAYGVYACRAKIEGEKYWYHGAANIGIRPMFKVDSALVETYIFDFDRDIYGKTLRVQPVKRLRGEAKFDSLKELVSQIGDDCIEARNILSKI